MANSGAIKLKMIKLWEILQHDSDSEHPLSTNELCRRLCDDGIPCNRKTIQPDVSVLNQHGFEVQSERRGKDRVYWVEDRTFDVPEIKILIDAIQAASFITEKKTEQLVQKIAALAGSHRADVLTENIVRFNNRKHTNERIFYTVDRLERAILEKRQATFLYFDLDENRNRIFRRNKERYIVHPISLVFLEDNYYLMCFCSGHEGIVSFRLDRMFDVQETNQPSCSASQMPEEMIARYTQQAFHMFSGEQEEVTLRFGDNLIGVIYDRFGEDIKMTRQKDGSIIAKVTVQISPTFWGWFFQFVGEMQLVAPKELIDTYRSLLRRAFD